MATIACTRPGRRSCDDHRNFGLGVDVGPATPQLAGQAAPAEWAPHQGANALVETDVAQEVQEAQDAQEEP